MSFFEDSDRARGRRLGENASPMKENKMISLKTLLVAALLSTAAVASFAAQAPAKGRHAAPAKHHHHHHAARHHKARHRHAAH